jgi:predicted dehydrogenase
MRAPDTRVPLVGRGGMGRNHLRVLHETPGFDLVAVVDAKADAPSDLGNVPFLRSVAELASISFEAGEDHRAGRLDRTSDDCGNASPSRPRAP